MEDAAVNKFRLTRIALGMNIREIVRCISWNLGAQNDEPRFNIVHMTLEFQTSINTPKIRNVE